MDEIIKLLDQAKTALVEASKHLEELPKLNEKLTRLVQDQEVLLQKKITFLKALMQAASIIGVKRAGWPWTLAGKTGDAVCPVNGFVLEPNGQAGIVRLLISWDGKEVEDRTLQEMANPDRSKLYFHCCYEIMGEIYRYVGDKTDKQQQMARLIGLFGELANEISPPKIRLAKGRK